MIGNVVVLFAGPTLAPFELELFCETRFVAVAAARSLDDALYAAKRIAPSGRISRRGVVVGHWQVREVAA